MEITTDRPPNQINYIYKLRMPITTPTFIDFEASSLDVIESYPLEVGICFPDGTTSSWLIKPHVLWRDWSERSAKVHGIPLSELHTNGSEIGSVINSLNKLLKGTVYCDALTFDSFWLQRLYKAGNSVANFQLDSLGSILSSSQIEQWQDIREEVISQLGITSHRAANDALILHKTWQRLHS